MHMLTDTTDLEAEEKELNESIKDIETQIENVSIDCANHQNELEVLKHDKKDLEQKTINLTENLYGEEKRSV